MGGATAVLGRQRLVALATLVALLATYDGVSDSLPNLTRWWDIALLGLAVIPATFCLVLLVLPLARAKRLAVIAIALVAFAALTTATGPGILANFAKLAAATAVGFWIVGFLESLGLVVIVATIIPWVDAWSVWRGPTHTIVTKREDVFQTLAVAFPTPGDGAATNLGLPDLLFFAVFLAACLHFGLRTRWTWLALTASFGITMAISVAVGASGAPALPGLSIAFLAVNGDLLWRKLRPARAQATRDTL